MLFKDHRIAAATLSLLWLSSTAGAAERHNVILFIPDGLRAGSVTSESAPTLARLRDQGVNFANSHSLFPTFTTANASAFATGHGLGDTGDFSNVIYTARPIQVLQGSVTPFLESDPVLREVDQDFGGNYLDEASLLALASQAGYSTASLGKLGPVGIFDTAALAHSSDKLGTLIVDDASGHAGGVALSPEWQSAFNAAHVEDVTPSRGANGDPGNFERPGTVTANLEQQRHFLQVTTEVVLPKFQSMHQPFMLVYWSRDPDGTQHNQGDSFQRLRPGINGPTSRAAIGSVDAALDSIESTLRALGLYDDTDIIVAADHGFATIAKSSKTSVAASRTYADVPRNDLPNGFLAIDLTEALRAAAPKLRLFDPDADAEPVANSHHPSRGNGLIGLDAEHPQVVVAANGGSDLIYLPAALAASDARALARRIVAALLKEDYVSGLFVDEGRFGSLPGALSLADIGLAGQAVTPRPAVVVNFRSFSTGCEIATLCTAVIADTGLQVGQGMHGSFSRAETRNFMAARGPDFREHLRSTTPASNADIGATIAHLFGLVPPSRGSLLGRTLGEALNQAATTHAVVKTQVKASRPAQNKLRTVIDIQIVDGTTYWDAGGFPGRTVGLRSDTRP